MQVNQQINTGVKQREVLFIRLYQRCFPAVARYVRKMGGNLEQARDVFQEALLAYYEKTRNGELELRSDEHAYLFGIARNVWAKRHKEAARNQALDYLTDVREPEEPAPSSKKLLRYLEAAGQKCMELLRAFYYDNAGPEEIATHFGFSGIRSATVQKYKCLEKVRETVKQKSLAYEDFLE
jgi:RNA polymerase sigma factor (sigma-70 family)